MSDCNCNCNTIATVDCSNEPTQLALATFIELFVGEVTKQSVNGRCIWTLPCNLNEEIAEFPRNPNEGWMCYVQRLLNEGIVGETNTGVNVGTGTGLIFRDKTGVDLNFKSLLEGLNTNITNNADDITIAFEWQAAPANKTSAGTVGQLAFDTTGVYLCYQANLWGKIAYATDWT